MTILGIRGKPAGSGAAFWSTAGSSGVVFGGSTNKGDLGSCLSSFRSALFLWLSPSSDKDIEQVVFCKWAAAEVNGAYDAQVEMIGVVRQVCSHFSVPFADVSRSTAVSEVAGASRAPQNIEEGKRVTWMNRRLREGCAARGFTAKNQTIAEAYAAIEQFRAGLPVGHPWASSGPLFQEAS